MLSLRTRQRIGAARRRACAGTAVRRLAGRLPARGWTAVAGLVWLLLPNLAAAANLKTWDGRHAIDQIEVTVVYFLPRDRTPLVDWRERVAYFCRRIERFHQREFQGQSTLTTKVHAEPFRSARTTRQLRSGDGDFIFFQTLREVDTNLGFAAGPRQAYPILLVLSDINWRNLEDFYRLRSVDGKLEFEGQLIGGRHFPGAASGGARATYLADRGVGWGLVSADGWRVPYSGTDCVVYHEGVGHTVGLPHPKKGNGSVMSLGQYRGWISQSWLDDDQKQRLGWTSPETPIKRDDLFSVFTALPEPLVPKPDEDVYLRLTWPEQAAVKTLRVRLQTELPGPWFEASSHPPGPVPERVRLGSFDRPTPVSYRVDAELADGQQVELWGYFQVCAAPDQPPLPRRLTETVVSGPEPQWDQAADLLPLIDIEKDTVLGKWGSAEHALESNKQYGARIEIPYQPPAEYLMTVIVRPLDTPNGLILGQRSGDNRFLVLINFAAQPQPAPAVNALEDVDGRNFSGNATTLRATLLAKDRPSTVHCTVRRDSVTVHCDGREIINWKGKSDQLSLSDYWKTPTESALFVGAYDCRYRFERITLTPITGTGRSLRDPRP